MTTEISKAKLAEAIVLLGKTYNDPSSKKIEQSIDLLKKSIQSSRVPKGIKFSEVPDIREGFIPVGPKWYQDWHGGGARPQEFKLWGATPHGGKTHLLVWDGAQYILNDYKVLHFNGEDILADVKEYYYKAVRDEEALENNLMFVDMQDSRFGVPEIEAAYLDLHEQGYDSEIIIVDHVDLMRGAFGKDDWQAVSEVMAELKMFAKRTNTIVITASQMNFSQDGQKGMARFYRAKVGKAGEADLIFMVESQVGDEYTISRVKARGRRRLTDNTKVILADWDKMKLEVL